MINIIVIVIIIWIIYECSISRHHQSGATRQNRYYIILLKKFEEVIKESKDNIFYLDEIVDYKDNYFFINEYNKLIKNTKDIQNTKREICDIYQKNYNVITNFFNEVKKGYNQELDGHFREISESIDIMKDASNALIELENLYNITPIEIPTIDNKWYNVLYDCFYEIKKNIDKNDISYNLFQGDKYPKGFKYFSTDKGINFKNDDTEIVLLQNCCMIFENHTLYKVIDTNEIDYVSQKKSKNVKVTNSNFADNSKYTLKNNDKYLIYINALSKEKTSEFITYLHQRVDGGPDLRYKDNPSEWHTHYHIEYIEHVLTIDKKEYKFIYSDLEWCDKFQKAFNKYKKSNYFFNEQPDFDNNSNLNRKLKGVIDNKTIYCDKYKILYDYKFAELSKKILSSELNEYNETNIKQYTKSIKKYIQNNFKND